mmetsp:Transcript_96/g.134  ORF Transcript_96/g.134 Transcript_96/m.134 type:complete len:377 (+) Transcript_96:280-1410(+)
MLRRFAKTKRCFPNKTKRLSGLTNFLPPQFKRVQAAYEILKDPDKKELYDKYGEEGVRRGGKPVKVNGYNCTVDRMVYRRPRKGPDLRYPLKVQLAEFYKGSVRRLQLNKDRICPQCRGVGGDPKGIAQCQSCDGKGMHILPGQLGWPQWKTCSQCQGAGKQIHPGSICNCCNGKRVVKCSKRLEVHVEKGMKGGDQKTFTREANESPNLVAGDVVVIFEEQEHKYFKREGVHLRMRKRITLIEALLGFQFVVRHLDDRILLVKSEPGVVYRPGDVKAIMEEGMPAHRDPFTTGNLYIEIEVEFPRKLTEDQAKMFARIFPVPRGVPAANGAQEAKLVSVDIEQERRKFQYIENSRKPAYSEDRVDESDQTQCRTQ